MKRRGILRALAALPVLAPHDHGCSNTGNAGQPTPCGKIAPLRVEKMHERTGRTGQPDKHGCSYVWIAIMVPRIAAMVL